MEKELKETSIPEVIEKQQENAFDYGDMKQQQIEELENRVITAHKRGGDVVHYIGETLYKAKEFFGTNTKKYNEWCEYRFKIKRSMRNYYISAYEVLSTLRATLVARKNISDIGVKKISSLEKLLIEQREELLEKAPLRELSQRQVEKLTQIVEKEKKYSEEIIEQVRKEEQKDKGKEDKDICSKMSTIIKESSKFKKEDFDKLNLQKQQDFVMKLIELDEWLQKMKEITRQNSVREGEE